MVRGGVILQEFAYWTIYAGWDLLEPFEPTGEAEWTLKNSSELKTKMPEFYQAYEGTVAKVMVAPNRESLKQFVSYEPSN